MVVRKLFPEINYALLASPEWRGRADVYLGLYSFLFSRPAWWLHFEIGTLVKEKNFLKVFIKFISKYPLVELRLVMLKLSIIINFIVSLWWTHFLGCSLLYQWLIHGNIWILTLNFTINEHIFGRWWNFAAIIELAGFTRSSLLPQVSHILVLWRFKRG